MGSNLKFFLKIIFGITLGIIPSLLIIQNNQQIKLSITKSIIKLLEKEWDAKIRIEKVNVNILTGVISLKNLKIESLNKTKCTWLCKLAKITILKHDSIADKKICLHLDLDENVIKTEFCNGELGFSNLLQSIFKTEPEDFNAKSFHLKKNKIVITNLDSKPTINLEGSILLKKDKDENWHGRLSFLDGSLIFKNEFFLKNFCGLTEFHQGENLCNLELNINHKFNGKILSQNDKIYLSGKLFSNKLLASAKILLPKDLKLTLSFDKTFSTDKINKNFGNYTVNLEKNDFNLQSSGKIFTNNNDFIFTGKTPYGKYFLATNFTQKFPIKSFVLTKKGKPVVNFKKDLSIKYSFLNSLLPANIRKWILGNKGKINIEIDRSKIFDTKKIHGKITFSNGKIYVPGNYNLITDFSADFKIKPKTPTGVKIELKNVTLTFYKGTVFCNKIILKFDNKNNLKFIYADLQAKDLLINWKNEFFGFIDGNFIVSTTKILGDVIIKKSLFKENIFLQPTSQAFAGSIPIEIDLNIYNKQYLKISTPLIQTKATADLNVKIKKLFEPKVKGRIELRGGTLTFPKNKLFISSGKIDFIPTQINNPMINFLAKNRIKKYVITLQVTGQLKNPTIFLESNPELTEEQIISLLFAGSENLSLRSGFPTIIMQNLSRLILGSKKALPSTTSFFKKITEPLKYIQITPNFTNQSGRGGVKGTISVDVNQQLHAQIQKNFTMQDDLAFQLEYFLSDDINLKAIKDHRGDIGGEIEFVVRP